MKFQIFLFSAMFVFSSYAMDISKVTDAKLIAALTNVNSAMKVQYPDDFDAKAFGQYITSLRGKKLSTTDKVSIVESIHLLIPHLK